MTELTHTERETLAGVLAFIRRLVGAWDCCGTCAGGVLAAHDAAIRAETLRDAADGLNVAGVGFRPGWGSGNVEDLAALDALNKAVEWLRARAAQPTEGES